MILCVLAIDIFYPASLARVIYWKRDCHYPQRHLYCGGTRLLPVKRGLGNGDHWIQFLGPNVSILSSSNGQIYYQPMLLFIEEDNYWVHSWSYDNVSFYQNKDKLYKSILPHSVYLESFSSAENLVSLSLQDRPQSSTIITVRPSQPRLTLIFTYSLSPLPLYTLPPPNPAWDPPSLTPPLSIPPSDQNCLLNKILAQTLLGLKFLGLNIYFGPYNF